VQAGESTRRARYWFRAEQEAPEDGDGLVGCLQAHAGAEAQRRRAQAADRPLIRVASDCQEMPRESFTVALGVKYIGARTQQSPDAIEVVSS
jgi:hypothetical protein